MLGEPQRRKDRKERATRATEDRNELWEPSAAGALNVFVVDLPMITYKQSVKRSNPNHSRPRTSYFATFASNFSRTFSIFGLAWKVQ